MERLRPDELSCLFVVAMTHLPLTKDLKPFFFDAPTALFTLEDFYSELNRRLEDRHKQPIAQDVILEFQSSQ